MLFKTNDIPITTANPRNYGMLFDIALDFNYLQGNGIIEIEGRDRKDRTITKSKKIINLNKDKSNDYHTSFKVKRFLVRKFNITLKGDLAFELNNISVFYSPMNTGTGTDLTIPTVYQNQGVSYAR